MDMQHREHSKHNEYTYGWIFIQEIYLITCLYIGYDKCYCKFALTEFVCLLGSVSCNGTPVSCHQFRCCRGRMTSGVCCCGEKGYLSTCVNEECPPGMIVIN